MKATTHSLQAVARRIREEMSRTGVTDADLAAASGLNRSAVLVRLEGSVPWTLEELDAIAPVLGTRSWLLIAEAHDEAHEREHGQAHEQTRDEAQPS